MKVVHEAGIYATPTDIKLWVLNCLYCPYSEVGSKNQISTTNAPTIMP